MKFYDFLIAKLDDRLNQPDFNWQDRLPELKQVIANAVQKNSNLPQRVLNHLGLPALLAAFATSTETVQLYEYLAPSPGLSAEIIAAMAPGATLHKELERVVAYAILSKQFSDWDTTLIDVCEAYLPSPGAAPTDNVLPIISQIAFRVGDTNVKKLLAKPAFYTFAARKYMLEDAAFLWGCFVRHQPKGIINDPNNPATAASWNGLQKIITFWQTPDPQSISAMILRMRRFKSWSFIWELASDPTYRLAIDLVLNPMEAEDESLLFSQTGVFTKIVNLSNSFQTDDGLKTVLGKLLKYSDLENEIIAAESLDILSITRPLLFIAEMTSNEAVLEKLVAALLGLNQNAWDQSFTGTDHYLLNLAIQVQQKQSAFFLKNEYFDILVKFAQKQNDQLESATEFQKENWSKLVALLDQDFNEEYKGKITDILKGKQLTVTESFFDHQKEYFRVNNLKGEVRLLQAFFEKSLKDKDFHRLVQLDFILKKEPEVPFKPEKSFSKVVEKDLNAAYVTADSAEHRELIQRLSVFFNAELNTENNSEQSVKSA